MNRLSDDIINHIIIQYLMPSVKDVKQNYKEVLHEFNKTVKRFSYRSDPMYNVYALLYLYRREHSSNTYYLEHFLNDSINVYVDDKKYSISDFYVAKNTFYPLEYDFILKETKQLWYVHIDKIKQNIYLKNRKPT